MVKKKEFNPKVQWAKFIAVLVLYLLFLYWVGSWWGLLVIPFIYDVYITKKIKWQWWKEAERPVKFLLPELRHSVEFVGEVLADG